MTARRVTVSPLRDFFHAESAGGIVLVIATITALVWANSPWKQSYFELWHTHLSIALGSHSVDLTLEQWVNEGLMTIFFLVVGLEIKRELVEGELRDPRTAALPAIAAVGGMIVPALVYVAINAGGNGAGGWGIPMATDIAMAIGVVSLLGSRVPPSLKLFLLALAIVDDIGAIVVIAIFYSDSIHLVPLLVAVGFLLSVAGARLIGIRFVLVYVALGAGLWLALHDAGVHTTLAGVVLGLMAPTRPFRQSELVDEDALLDISTVETAAETAMLARESVSVVEWMEHLLHPWTSFVIVPLFALANAGIPITSTSVSNAFTSRDHLRRRHWPRRRQAHRRSGRVVDRDTPQGRHVACRRDLAGDRRRGRARRHRLHGLDLRRGLGVRRRTDPPERGEDRDPRGVAHRRGSRLADLAS